MQPAFLQNPVSATIPLAIVADAVVTCEALVAVLRDPPPMPRARMRFSRCPSCA
jgi:hypothetical protein